MTDLRADPPSIVLSDRGHKFAAWLLETGKKADFLKSSIGNWGEASYPDWMPPRSSMPSNPVDRSGSDVTEQQED